MGRSKSRREAFFRSHPLCVFCGGEKPATTIEHCPPRSLFQNRDWPVGFEFPACIPCNLGTGDEDLLIALLARLDPVGEGGNQDGRLLGLMRNVNSQYPGMLEKMMPSANEARRRNKEFGVQPAPGETHQDASPVKIPAEMDRAIRTFALKLSKGIYYRETATAFPNDGCVLFNWFTNIQIVQHGKYIVFDLMRELAGDVPILKRNGTFLNDQFEYKYSIAPEKHFFALQARFGGTFGFVVFGSTVPDQLESIVKRKRELSGQKGAFVVLQSPSLT